MEVIHLFHIIELVSSRESIIAGKRNQTAGRVWQTEYQSKCAKRQDEKLPTRYGGNFDIRVQTIALLNQHNDI
jgi:hypothetical protein